MRSWDKGQFVSLVTVTFFLFARFIDPNSWVLCIAKHGMGQAGEGFVYGGSQLWWSYQTLSPSQECRDIFHVSILPCLVCTETRKWDRTALLPEEFLAAHEVSQRGKGDAQGQRCSRALDRLPGLSMGNLGATLNSSKNWEYSIPLHCLPAKMTPKDCLSCPWFLCRHRPEMGVTFMTVFRTSNILWHKVPHLAASKAGFHSACALDMEVGMWHISPYLPFPHLSLSETDKFAAKIWIKTHGNVQLYVFKCTIICV